MGNSGMLTGAFSSTSGKADTVLTTSGDVLYYTSSRQRLPIGDEGQILTVSGSDLPSWAAAASGAITFLGSSVLGSANANITVSGNFDFADYSYFIVKGEMSKTSGASALSFRMNDISTEYWSNNLLNTDGTLSATTSGSQNYGLICTDAILDGSTESTSFVQIIMANDADQHTQFRPTWSVITPLWHQGTASPSDNQQTSGLINQNSMTNLTKIDYYFQDGGTFRAGSGIYLYGVSSS